MEQNLIRNIDGFEQLYGGRTNQVWKVPGLQENKVLKVYSNKFQNPLFRNDSDLEARCLSAFADLGLAPRLSAAGTFDEQNWVLYDHAPGRPWQINPEPVARALRKLHVQPVQIAAPFSCNGSKDLADHGASILGLLPVLERSELEALRPEVQVGPTSKRCVIHGDPVAGNVLMHDGHALLIDWQCPALGDPSEDLAVFLSPAMQQLYRGQTLTEAEANDFLDAYGDPDVSSRYYALKPWYHWRMAAYCLWREKTGTPDYAAGYALECDALRKSLAT